jgi:peptidoglycan L-alanyl-D-glutamate endopeptidase CwlK
MSRRINDLSDRFRPLAIELLARLTEAGIAVVIVDTLRTPSEHAANLAAGVSWTTRSKHLDGDAIDICPYELYTLTPGGDKLAWNAPHESWERIGRIGEALGLRWGGRWRVRDYGHFEYLERETESLQAGVVREAQGSAS